MKASSCCVFLFIMVFFQIPQVDAANRAPFSKLASSYRSAVSDFRTVIGKVRGIDRADKSRVDRLLDATKNLQLAAKNPRHQNRLFAEWRAVQRLHMEVEQSIFGKYTPHHGMQATWVAAIYRYTDLDTEFIFHVENPRHGNSVRRVENSNSVRNQYFRSIYLAAGTRER